MPPVDSVFTRKAPRRKRTPQVVVHVHVTPDQADRNRSPARRARDRRAVNRTIAHVQARARVTPDQADRNRSPIQQARDRQAVARSVASSRQKALAKRGRGGGVRAIKRELEGHGLLAHVLSGTANRAVSKLGSGTSLAGVLPVSDNVAARTAKDLINAPAQLVPSAYVPAAGLVEALRGHPERIKQFGADISQHDPIFNLAAAGIDAAKGNAKAHERLKRFKTSASEHPGFLMLEAMGLRGALGRGAGGAVRTGAKVTGSETLRKIGTTERTPKTLKRTELAEHRAYSKDLTRKAAQVIQDKQGARRAARLRELAKNEANPKERAALKREARRVDPTRIDDKDIQKRVDEHVAITEDVRRTNQARVLAAENKTYKKAKDAGPVVSLLAQRIVRPTLKSMERYQADLKLAAKDLKGSRLRANEQLQHDLGEAIAKIKSGKLKPDQLKEIADRYTERSVGSQAALTARSIYAPEQSERRAVEPFAIREMKARRDPELLAERTKAAKKTARGAARTATRARGKASGRRLTHRGETLKAIEALKGERNPAALREMERRLIAEKQGREKQLKRSTKRAARLSKQSRLAADEAKTAKALQKADPLLLKGRELPTSEILAAMEKIHGKGARAAVVSQRPAHEAGGGDFYQGAASPKKGEKRRLGGGATLQGTLDASPDRLLRQHVRAQALADAHDSYNDFVNQFARRKKGGKLETHKSQADATEKANDLNAKGDVQWRVVRVDPFADERRSVFESDDPGHVESETLTGALKGEGQGEYAIVPEAAAKQMQQHMDSLSTNVGARGLRSLSSGFRRTVLATSLPWMTGNIAEAGLRSAINRVGPGSLIRGHRVLRAIDRLDPAGAQRAKARLVGGGHYAYADRKIHANLDAYSEGLVKDVTSHWQEIRKQPVAKQVAWFWDRWTHHAFNTVNKSIEQQFQTAMLGKAAKERLMPDALRATSQKAIDEMAHGVVNPNTAAALKREIDKMYGRYQGFSPSERFWIANYTPFGAWTANAAELLAMMPERHPATTLAGTATVNATEDWRQEHGLDVMGGEGQLPLFLQGSIPLPGGAHLRATRFTPMGLATDPLGTVGGMVLPQFRSVLNAFEGLDWTGKKLKTKDGGEPQIGDEAKAALVAFLDSTIPGLAVGKRVAKKGLIALPQSAVGYTPGKQPTTGGGSSSKPRSRGADRFKSNRFGGSSRYSGPSRFSGASRFK